MDGHPTACSVNTPLSPKPTNEPSNESSKSTQQTKTEQPNQDDHVRKLLMTLTAITIRFPQSNNTTDIPESNKRGSTVSTASIQPPTSYLHQSTGHSKYILDRVNEQRQRNKLCDVVLQLGSQRIAAHRIILSAGSQYFCDIFGGDCSGSVRSETVQIPVVDESAFTKLIDFLYTGELKITTDTVQNLLATATVLKIAEIQQICSEFLQVRLHSMNCLSVLRFAEVLKLSDLVKACTQFVGQHFGELVENSADILLLDQNLFEQLIFSKEMNIPEDDRLKAILRWVGHDSKARESVAPKLCSHIQVPRLSREYFIQLCQAEAQWGNNPWLNRFLMQALVRELQLVQSPTPTPEPSKSPTYTDVIVVAGGGLAKDAVECFDLKSQIWSSVSSSPDSPPPSSPNSPTIPNLPRPRHGCAAVAVDHVLYVIGGTLEGVTASIDIYNSACHTWKAGPEMQSPRRWLGATVLNRKVFAIGGFDGTVRLASSEVLDPSTDKWGFIAPMLSPRSSLGCASWKNRIYAVGGFSRDDTRLSTVECYNPDTNTWSMIAPMASPRCGLGVCVIENKLYAVGGWSTNAGVSNATELLDLDTNSWKTVACMNVKRGGLGLVAYNGLIYAVGGWDGENRMTSLERYNPVSDKWTVLPGQMKIPRYNSGIAVLQFRYLP